MCINKKIHTSVLRPFALFATLYSLDKVKKVENIYIKLEPCNLNRQQKIVCPFLTAAPPPFFYYQPGPEPPKVASLSNDYIIIQCQLFILLLY